MTIEEAEIIESATEKLLKIESEERVAHTTAAVKAAAARPALF